MEWLATLNWGDVPSWVGVLIAIVVPLVAYFERNRIAGFFRRKAAEPLPQLPPARFALAPIADGLWALVNTGVGEGFNVRLDVEEASAAILSSGFWPFFPGQAYGSFSLQLSETTIRFADVSSTSVLVSWQDKNGQEFRETMSARGRATYRRSLDWPKTDEGKVRTIDTADRDPAAD